uniref:Uncharacterized protein n=1 Tax=Brassica oleracea TaxID=3712 RepID=A0A3P6D7C4_BRAOL|nr:unnamed protein product [Brassica oleracea]
MAESPSQSGAQLVAHQAESDLASLVFVGGLRLQVNVSLLTMRIDFVGPESPDTLKFAEMSQQVQVGMDNMLKFVNEIDGNSVGIKEEIDRSKEFAMEKKRVLEEEKEQFQKAAYTILDMLSNRV